ncbi:MAG TPA: glycerophosphodiester phosphodiesterase family protein [Methylomirabilota bacterium]|nr:glycerophosphodiester phosphodiesterase family protein [Methylomirabilota bacterium]
MRRRGWPALALVVLAGVAAAAPPRAPLVAAHRGGAGLWPENSLTAFRGAVALGVDALEFDVHLTADGVPVVIHDVTLDRTTTARGLVRATTLEALRAARLLDRSGAPTEDRVPTLAEVLEVAAPAPVAVLPEIKVDVVRGRYPDIETHVVALLRAYGLTARASVQSFDDATLRRLRALDPALRTMLLVGRVRMVAAMATGADAVRWAQDVGAGDLGIEHRLIDADLVAAARAAGIRVAAWTVNEDADVRRLSALGVDVVMTDRPDRVRRLLVIP